MSLNKILLQGKIGDGVDIECSSIKCSSLVQKANFPAGLTAGQSLFSGSVETFGELKCEQLKLQQRSVTLNGVVLPANQGIVGQGGVLNNVSNLENWSYQKYGDTLLIQGQLVASWINAGTRNCTVDINIPSGFTITSALGKKEVCSGSAGPNGIFLDNQPLVCLGATVQTATTMRLTFVTGDGSLPRIINTPLRFEFSLIVRSVFLV